MNLKRMQRLQFHGEQEKTDSIKVKSKVCFACLLRMAKEKTLHNLWHKDELHRGNRKSRQSFQEAIKRMRARTLTIYHV